MLQRLICLIAITLLPPTTPKPYLRLAYFLIIFWLPVKILQYPIDNICWKQNQTFPSISLDRFQRESSNSSIRVSSSSFSNKYWLSGIRCRMILLQKFCSFNYSSVKPTGPPRCSVLTTELTLQETQVASRNRHWNEVGTLMIFAHAQKTISAVTTL